MKIIFSTNTKIKSTDFLIKKEKTLFQKQNIKTEK